MHLAYFEPLVFKGRVVVQCGAELIFILFVDFKLSLFRVHFSTVTKTVISPDTVISPEMTLKNYTEMTLPGEMTLFVTVEKWTLSPLCDWAIDFE